MLTDSNIKTLIENYTERDKMRLYLYLHEIFDELHKTDPRKLTQLKYNVKNIDKLNEINRRCRKKSVTGSSVTGSSDTQCSANDL